MSPELFHNEFSYLGRFVECPAEKRVIRKGFLDTLYGGRNISLSQRDDFNSHYLLALPLLSHNVTMTDDSEHRFGISMIASTGSAERLGQRYGIGVRIEP